MYSVLTDLSIHAVRNVCFLRLLRYLFFSFLSRLSPPEDPGGGELLCEWVCDRLLWFPEAKHPAGGDPQDGRLQPQPRRRRLRLALQLCKLPR